MSEKRKDKINRFRFENDKVSSLLSGILLRCILSEKTMIPAHELKFYYGEYGKPFLSNAVSCCFSMSHTRNFSVMVTDNFSVGIDTEYNATKLNESVDIANSFFCENENQIFRNSGYSSEKFYEIWTAREAYVKMTGRGLGSITNSFDVEKNDQNYQIITERLGDYTVSLCCRRDINEIGYRYWSIYQLLDCMTKLSNSDRIIINTEKTGIGEGI